ncbi:hypothetical protein LSTR_LSTR001185 [Laodelphax striatellus]|uniref:RNA helicase n=1 Tax=Laodelphax striatellus TaxID=195883 RepID=A0A482X1E5_LAOST|nr:hypothetical protein LSTR_LSTR001185 [Laodelphax striatellus]
MLTTVIRSALRRQIPNGIYSCNRCINRSSAHLTKVEEEIFDVLYPEKQKHVPFNAEEFKKDLVFAKKSNIKTPKTKRNGVPIIKCKRPEFNHYRGDNYAKFEVVPLASNGWNRSKAKGDYFTIDACPEKEAREALFWYYNNAGFADLGLSQEIVDGLEKNEIKKPTKIQVDAIPVLMAGRCSVMAAETGCGKTLAFLLPMLEKIRMLKRRSDNRPPNHPLGLIITPGRELAHQIHEIATIKILDLDIESKLLMGGHTKRKMLNPEFEFFDLLIGTIGAISKLTSSGIFNVSAVQHVVLDEADTLLDDSFSDYLLNFLRKIPFGDRAGNSFHPSTSQITLVSATMPRRIPPALLHLVPSSMFHHIEGDKLHHVLSHVPQHFHRMILSERPAKLLSTVKESLRKKNPVMIFSNKTPTCDWCSMFLNENGVKCVNLNGNMPYEVRLGKFEEFQCGEYDVISSTDIGSRGLDTVRVKHVINYDFPHYMADYIHRCGRTGRLGEEGCMVTNFVTAAEEIEVVKQIEMAVRIYTSLPDVTGNISRLISKKHMRDEEF